MRIFCLEIVYIYEYQKVKKGYADYENISLEVKNAPKHLFYFIFGYNFFKVEFCNYGEFNFWYTSIPISGRRAYIP